MVTSAGFFNGTVATIYSRALYAYIDWAAAIFFDYFIYLRLSSHCWINPDTWSEFWSIIMCELPLSLMKLVLSGSGEPASPISQKTMTTEICLLQNGNSSPFTMRLTRPMTLKSSGRNFARRIDLTSLQLFVAVCELGSIGKGAARESCAFTSPAWTRCAECFTTARASV